MTFSFPYHLHNLFLCSWCSDGIRVARCPVFDRSLWFFGDLSGEKTGLNRTMSRPVFRPLLVICSGMCIQQPGETGSPQYLVLKFP